MFQIFDYFIFKTMFDKNINRFTIPTGITLSVQFSNTNGYNGSINRKVLDYYIQLNISKRGELD